MYLHPGHTDAVTAGMADAIDLYRKHLQRRHLAPSTITRYATDLRAFARHIAPVRPLQADTETIEAFLDSRDLEARARYRWLSELHKFFGWAVAHGHAEHDPTIVIDRPRLSRLLPRPIDDDALTHALNASGPQMRAWLALGAFAGLRCCEIASLDRAGIGSEALRVTGKGGHERIVPLHPVVADALDRCSLARSGPVFRREGGQPFTPKEVSRRGALFFEALGYGGVTFHQLRHSFGTRTYRYSLNLRATQELLGHSRLDTAAGYAAVGSADLAAVVAALPSLGG